MTYSPPYFFIPNLRPLESRPLLLDPPCFFEAKRTKTEEDGREVKTLDKLDEPLSGRHAGDDERDERSVKGGGGGDDDGAEEEASIISLRGERGPGNPKLFFDVSVLCGHDSERGRGGCVVSRRLG